MSCEVSGRQVTTDEECVMSPIWSPKLTQASSTPGHSSHTSCLQSPFQDPRLKLATTAGKRAAPPGPDHLVTVHKQPLAGFAPLTHTCLGASGGPARSQVEGVQWQRGPLRELPRDRLSASLSRAPGATQLHKHCPAGHQPSLQPWRWHHSRTPGNVTPAWRPHSQPTLSENTNWKVRATRKRLTHADVCIWRAASLHFHSSCT